MNCWSITAVKRHALTTTAASSASATAKIICAATAAESGRKKWWFKTKRCRWRWTDEMIKWFRCAAQHTGLFLFFYFFFSWEKKMWMRAHFFPINIFFLSSLTVWVQINMKNIDVTKWWHELESLLHWRFVTIINIIIAHLHHQYLFCCAAKMCRIVMRKEFPFFRFSKIRYMKTVSVWVCVYNYKIRTCNTMFGTHYSIQPISRNEGWTINMTYVLCHIVTARKKGNAHTSVHMYLPYNNNKPAQSAEEEKT